MNTLHFSDLCAQGHVAGKRVLIWVSLPASAYLPHAAIAQTDLQACVAWVRMALQAGAAVVVLPQSQALTFPDGLPELALAQLAASLSDMLGSAVASVLAAGPGLTVAVGQVVVLGRTSADPLCGAEVCVDDVSGETRDVAVQAGAPAVSAAVVPSLDVARGVGMMGSETSLRKILKTVLDSMSGNLLEIEAALQAGDVATANRLLHAIKGYLPIFASDALADQVAQVEGVSKTASVDVLTPLWHDLAPHLAGLLDEVRKYLSQV